MRNISFYLLALVSLLAPAMPAAAQDAVENLSKTFDAIRHTLAADLTAASNESYSDGGCMQMFSFSTTGMGRHAVEKLDGQLKAAMPSACRSWLKKAGTETGIIWRIAYGELGNKQFQLESTKEKNCNLQVFHDPADPSRRYVFILVWSEDGDRLDGSAFKFYGIYPQREKAVPEEAGGEAFRDTVPRNAADFVARFGDLAAIFASNMETYKNYQTLVFHHKATDAALNTPAAAIAGAAGKMMTLCVGYGNLLDEGQRKTLAVTIGRLRESLGDKFKQVAALLDGAKEALER